MKPYYDDGQVTIYNGDLLSLIAQIPDATIDALITDPPYCSGGMVRGDRTQSTVTKYQQTDVQKFSKLEGFTGDTRDQRAFGYWSALWLAEALRATKPGGVCATFTDWRQLPTLSDSIQAAGWIWRGLAVWDKGGGARPALGRFANQAEYVVWGSNGPLENDRGIGALPGVFQHPPLYENRDEKFHIAAKPVPIMRHVVSLCARGGTVLDPFMGSGTTLVAAKALGYRAIGIEIEIEERYCEIAVKRLQQSILPLMEVA